MKRVVIWVLILAILLLGGVIALRRSVVDRGMEWGGMENPEGTTADPVVLSPEERQELVSMSWYQNAESAGSCFFFSVDSSGPERLLRYDYRDMDGQERVDLDGTPVSDEQWEALADLLRQSELPGYVPLSPDLLDATDSPLQVCWRADGEVLTENLCGAPAESLRLFLMELAEDTGC